MKIVLMADLHLSDHTGTPEEAALDWALNLANSMATDVVLCLGDVTACGSADAAMRYGQKAGNVNCPVLNVPGNSDVRMPSTAPLLERCFSDHDKGCHIGDIHFVGINTAQGRILPAERARLQAVEASGCLFIYSHHSPAHLDQDSREFMRQWIDEMRGSGRRVLMWAYGHIHRFMLDEFQGVPTMSVRALDPNKCIGGAPQIIVMDWNGERLEWTEKCFDEALPVAWSREERAEFTDWLGITCYDVPRDMSAAISHGIRHIEWRGVREEHMNMIREWRRAGGQSFSVHMPSIGYDGGVRGQPGFQACAVGAVQSGADMITLHPPYVLNQRMLSGDETFERLADAMSGALKPVAEAGIDILVENSHTKFGTGSDTMQREFGCAPIEVMTWRQALEERLGRETCGFRLDVGHARNNVPLSQDYPIGKWYALIGSQVHGYHLHQTILDADGRMHNHHPITGMDDGLISFDGFLWAWHTGRLRHAPLILEIREGEGAVATWLRLQALLGENR